MIERTVPGGREVAVTDPAVGGARADTARAILSAWGGLGRSFSRVHINHLGHVWYEEAGERHYLGVAPDGFAWPADEEGVTR